MEYSCCDQWKYKRFGYETNRIPFINNGSSFKVSFEIYMRTNDEWDAITGINIRCGNWRAPTISSMQRQLILAKQQACFDAESYSMEYAFNPPKDGVIV